MARQPKTKPPPSLIHLFRPPEGYRGAFGWICGYSADAGFLDLAAEEFTLLSRNRRASAGRISLVGLLDLGNSQIAPSDAPGVLHVPTRKDVPRDFRLMHAKVALLGFVNDAASDKWWIRLVVSTGNWTRQTVEESLDLAWYVDLQGAIVSERTDDVRQACADLRAASDFLSHLRARFDLRILSPQLGGRHGSESYDAMVRLDGWTAHAATFAGRRKPRFFDNRRRSLLRQLPELALTASGEVARNYVGMGSGYFEGAADKRLPVVPQAIISRLQGRDGGQRLLTADPEVDLFVNPACCQAIASNLPAVDEAGWTVRPPGQPEHLGAARRTLHSKFILSANWRAGSDKCSSAWLYLGSGNLTEPGFLHAASRQGGNLEAGVVVGLPDASWKGLQDVLPVQWNESVDSSVNRLHSGPTMEGRVQTFFAPPVSCLHGFEGQDGFHLVVKDESSELFQVLTPDQTVCARGEDGTVVWPGSPPRQVLVRWEENGQVRQCLVPVVDAFGRVAAAPLSSLDLESAWSQLVNFPLPPPEEESDEVVSSDGSNDPDGQADPGRRNRAAIYPIRSVMQLIESISAMHDRLQELDWPTWCRRLEQTLSLAAKCETVERCRQLNVNVLSPLRQPPFRPTFAADASTEAGRKYDDVLSRIEESWKVHGLPEIRGAG